jgi:SAM-dependent methyltransferase
MSVGRLAGSGTAGADTEPARRRGAERRRTGRRPGTDASTRGIIEPGQGGPESNVVLLGQEAGPGTSVAAPERAAAAPDGRAPAEAAARAAEATRAGAGPAKGAAAPTETAAQGAAAATETAPTEAAAPDTAARTGPAATEAATSDAAATADAAEEAAPAPDRAPPSAPAWAGLFARYTRDYVTGHDGHQITILQAGCTTADGDLGVGVLREAGADIAVSLIDDDQPVSRAALSADESLAGCVLGDLRTVPLPPRSQDIVLCALLLQRIDHAELVLDRLVAAIKPGGLLLLRFSDRDSSGGFLDRVLPVAARTALWRKRRPGQPGPYPAVYERLSSVRGVQAYALMRELVIAERRALGGLAGGMAEPRGFLAAQKLAAGLSRGRLTAAHEELLYVLRKPEDRFARIL